MSSRLHRLRGIVAELKRRRVFRATVVYVVGAFAALQGAEILAPALHLPEWTMTLLVVIALLGLPVTIGVAWAFDLGPEGLQRTPDAPAAAATGPAAPLADDAKPAVAVLPFLNMSPDPENEHFSDGVTEDVIAHLSKIRALTVISRTSVMPFKQRGQSLRDIGAQLGATALLDGSVRRIGDRVRIVAQLVDAATDRHLWAETYDRDLTDIFAIQTEVALHIAGALEAELSTDERSRIRHEPTRSLEAYELYLKGRHMHIRYTSESLRRAIRYYEDAIAIDPGYALAYAGITLAHAELGEAGGLDSEVARRGAVLSGERALDLDPTLADAHTAVAHATALWDYDFASAEAGFRRAIELSPSNADAHDLYGRLCAALGRFDEALALQRRARALDPLAHRLDVATTLLRAGRHAEAEAETRRALQFEPVQDRGLATLGWALLGQGRTAEGLAALERATDVMPESIQWLAQLGQARALTGDTEGAREILRRLEERAPTEYVSPYHLAYVYTGLGEHDRALDLLERAARERAGAVYAIRGSFLFAPLRSHPRFQALLDRMKPA